MKIYFRRFAAMAMLAACGFASLGAQSTLRADDELLTIGSDAPSLDIEHWVQDGDGKFGKVTKFTNGKVYVVEFWATWCGPCIASMPHIVEVQKKYADKGVQIISISDEPLDTVEGFLDGEVQRSEEKKTYRELTKSYSLTTDPDRSSHDSYMEPAKQNGIPCAFIVGKDGKIEWIGHPMQMDEALAAVVADKWDRVKYGDEFKKQQELQGLMQDVQVQVGGLIRKKKFAEALEKMDEFIGKVEDKEVKLQFSMMKVNLHQIAGSDAAEVSETLKSVFALASDNPLLANQVAWTVWEMKERGQVEDKGTLQGALALAKKAAAAQEGNMKAMTLDTVSHLEYALGNVAEALKVQEEAIGLSDESGKENLVEFLEELKEEIKNAKK
jgi:thiol-disulfide isomerase/thioredoxin